MHLFQGIRQTERDFQASQSEVSICEGEATELEYLSVDFYIKCFKITSLA